MSLSGDAEGRPGAAPVVIRAQIRAWLLGIPLLSLKAHITVGQEGGVPDRPLSPPDGRPGSCVARARQLVAENGRLLRR